MLHVLQVEEQELAICSGRRSISKNTTIKETKNALQGKEKEKEESFYIGGAATNKEKEKEKKKSP